MQYGDTKIINGQLMRLTPVGYMPVKQTGRDQMSIGGVGGGQTFDPSGLQAQIDANKNLLSNIPSFDPSNLQSQIGGLEDRISNIPGFDDSALRDRLSALEGREIPTFDPSGLQSQIQANKDLLSNMPQFDPSNLQSQIGSLQDKISGFSQFDPSGLQEQIQANKQLLSNIPQFDPSELQSGIAGLSKRISNIPQFDPSNLQSQIGGIEERLANIPQFDPSNLQSGIAGLKDRLDNLNIPEYKAPDLSGFARLEDLPQIDTSKFLTAGDLPRFDPKDFREDFLSIAREGIQMPEYKAPDLSGFARKEDIPTFDRDALIEDIRSSINIPKPPSIDREALIKDIRSGIDIPRFDRESLLRDIRSELPTPPAFDRQKLIEDIRGGIDIPQPTNPFDPSNLQKRLTELENRNIPAFDPSGLQSRLQELEERLSALQTPAQPEPSPLENDYTLPQPQPIEPMERLPIRRPEPPMSIGGIGGGLVRDPYGNMVDPNNLPDNMRLETGPRGTTVRFADDYALQPGDPGYQTNDSDRFYRDIVPIREDLRSDTPPDPNFGSQPAFNIMPGARPGAFVPPQPPVPTPLSERTDIYGENKRYDPANLPEGFSFQDTSGMMRATVMPPPGFVYAYGPDGEQITVPSGEAGAAGMRDQGAARDQAYLDFQKTNPGEVFFGGLTRPPQLPPRRDGRFEPEPVIDPVTGLADLTAGKPAYDTPLVGEPVRYIMRPSQLPPTRDDFMSIGGPGGGEPDPRTNMNIETTDTDFGQVTTSSPAFGGGQALPGQDPVTTAPTPSAADGEVQPQPMPVGALDPVLLGQTSQENLTDPLVRALYFGTADQPGFYQQLQQAGANLIGQDVPLQQTAGLTPLELLARQQAVAGLGGFEPFLQQNRDLVEQAIAQSRRAEELQDPYYTQAEEIYKDTMGAYDPSMTQQFYNPFEQAVVDKTVQDVMEAGEKQDIASRAREISSGAFGGSRARLGAEERREALGEGLAQALGAIRQRGFSEAQSTGMSEFARQQAAKRTGAQGLMGIGVGRGSAASQLGQQLAGYGSQIGGIGSTQEGLRAGQRGELAGFGGIGRGIAETGLSRIYQQMLRQQERPLGVLGQIGSMLPGYQQGSTQIGSQYGLPTDPSAAGLGAAFSAYGALAPRQGQG